MPEEPGRHDFKWVRGDSWEETWTWTDDDDEPFDFTDYSVVIELRTAPGAPLGLRLDVDNGGITMADPGTDGWFSIYGSPAQGEALTAAYYRHQVRLVDTLGEHVQTLAAGKATMLDELAVP